MEFNKLTIDTIYVKWYNVRNGREIITDRTIEVKRRSTHYEIYINDEFYSSCDFNELKEELEEIENEQRW